jgi:hypothetical protein
MKPSIFVFFLFCSFMPVAAQAQVVTGKGTSARPEIQRLQNDVTLLKQLNTNQAAQIAGLTSQVSTLIRAICPTCTGSEGQQDNANDGLPIQMRTCGDNEALTSTDGVSLSCISIKSNAGEVFISNSNTCPPGSVQVGQVYANLENIQGGLQNAQSTPQCQWQN